MAQCKNDVLFNKVFRNKLDVKTEITLEVIRDLPDCRKINTKYFTSAPEDATFDRFDIPENAFECMQDSCVNSGTLTLPTAGDVVYHIAEDAAEFAGGVIAGYAKGTGTITITLSDTSTFANADVYTANASGDGFSPLIFDIGGTPSSEIGSGWTPSSNGVYLKITTSAANMGISSLLILDSMEEFETTEVIKISCPTEITGDISLTVANATCVDNKYDTTTDPTISKTVTGKMVTSNFGSLNPMRSKVGEVMGFEVTNIRKTIVASGEHGAVTLPNALEGECGFYAAQVAEGCNADMLKRLTIPVLVDFDQDHFQVINNENGTTTVYFNPALVGKDAIIAYPKAVEVEESVDMFDNVNSFKARMSYPEVLSDGTKIIRLYNNVLVTAFPDGLSNADDQTMTFTFDIKRDKDGAYTHYYKVVGQGNVGLTA